MALRILVVEDDKHIRRILESLLTNEASLKAKGAEVISAADGEAGLKALEKGPFDLVITDLLMPRVDGFQFCRELRKHKFGATVPVIVTSAIYKDNAAQIRLKKEVGEHHFFAKPYEIRDLVKTVNKILEGTPKKKDPTPAVGVPALDRGESGSLADRAPARILLELHERKSTGILSITRGKVKKEVGLQSGILTSCDSNLRAETLGHFLVSRGVIDEKKHQAALTRAQARQELLGQALIELGWISEKDLLHQLAAQMRSKVAGMLRWRDGSYSYSPGQPPADRVQTPVEAPLLVFLGLNKTAHVDEIAQLLAGTRGRVGLTIRAERHRETFIRVFGPLGFEALAKKPLVEDLMSATDPGQMLTHLDALLLCGLAEIDTALVEKRASSEATDPIALERITAPPAPAQPQGNLYDSLFGEEPSEVKAIPIAEPSRPDAEALRKEILAEYLALPSRNSYEILGVAKNASEDQLSDALAQKLQQFRLERFADADLGHDYAKVEELHQAFQSAYETLIGSRAEYDRSLEAHQHSTSPIDAELLGTEAEALLLAGEAARAQKKLEQAVAAAPDLPHYHALLGWAFYLGGDGKRAVASLQQALQLDPEDPDAHDFAGRIAAAAQDDERAIAHLERALDAAPDRAEALTTLEGVYAKKNSWKLLERRYRKLIHRLGETKDPLRISLWARLADLYLLQLNDRDSAKVAYEVLSKLAPDDPAPREALARLGGAANRFAEHLSAQRWDAAFVAAACAQEEATAAEFYRRYRPRFLQRGAPIENWNSLRHPDDDIDLRSLFSRLLPNEDPAGEAIDLLPIAFARVLEYAARMLDVAVPLVHRQPDLASEVVLRGSVLVAGPQALALADRPQLAFRIGRALALPIAGTLSPRQLKEHLLASFLLVSPALRVEDPEGNIARLRDRVPPGLATEIRPLVEKLMKATGLNLSKFARGLSRTADRVGLVLCNDPAVALALTNRNEDLLAFALSDDYLALRDRLGLSVAV